ncbi:MAG: BMP family ABC transporter substrate-binding protein [Chloroflexota bacterium]
MILNSIRHFLLCAFLAALISGCTVSLPDEISLSNEEPTASPATPTALPSPEPTPTVTTKPVTCADEALTCVGLVTDIGQLTDRSFNQSAWEGAQRAEKDLLVKIDYVETVSVADYAENIDYFVQKEYDIIITVGFGLSEATLEAAVENPDIHFIGVDQFQASTLENVAGLIFPENEAGFLAGVLAAMVTKTDTIGAVLGPEAIPPIVAFKEGYELGAYAVNPEIIVLHEYHPGPIDIAFGDELWGANQARTMMDAGADVIFAAAGNTGTGALLEVANDDSSFCIGVDTDQWLVIPEARPCLMTSAKKEIQTGVFELISWSILGDFRSGNFVGDVSLADFHDFDAQIPSTAKNLLKDLAFSLANDTIEVDGSYTITNPPSVDLSR